MVKQELEGREHRDTLRHGMLFDGNQRTFLRDGQANGSKATVVIDPNKNPKTIDITNDLGTAQGIYRFIDNDTLEICRNQARGSTAGTRPSAFTSKPAVGHGNVYYLLKRDKAGPANPPPVVGVGDDGKNDLQKLQSVWKMVKQELEGSDHRDTLRHGILFNGNQYTFLRDGKAVGPRSTMVIDPSKNPKTIDISTDAGVAQGIYRFIDNDTLEICLNQARGPTAGTRPSAFTSKPAVGHGSIFYVLKRENGGQQVAVNPNPPPGPGPNPGVGPNPNPRPGPGPVMAGRVTKANAQRIAQGGVKGRGMSRTQVIGILGQPTASNAQGAIWTEGNRTITVVFDKAHVIAVRYTGP